MKFTRMIKLDNRLKTTFLNPYTIALLSLLLLMSISGLYFMDIDEGVWHVIGTSWSKYSMPPYKYVLDDKTPGIHMIFALSYRFFGLNKFFPRLLGAIFVVFSSLVLYKTALKLRDKSTALLTMTLFLLSSMWIKFSGPITSHTESFMVLFTCLAFYLVIFLKDKKNVFSYRLTLFLAGLCIGTALSFKQIALFDCTAFFLIFIFTDKKRDKKSLLFGSTLISCGIISALFLSIIPLILSDVPVRDYFSTAWVNIFTMFFKQKGTSASPVAKIFNFFPSWRSSDIVLFYPLLFLFIIQKKNLRQDKIPFYPLLLWLLFAFLGVNSVGFYWGHQFKQIIPPLALIGGIGLSKLKDYPFIARKKKIINISAAVIIVLWFPWVSLTAHLENKGLRQVKNVGLWLKQSTTPNDYVYCYGTVPYGYGMIIQAYSERKPPSKYITPFSIKLNNNSKHLANDIIKNRPKYIVIPERLHYKIPSSLEKTLDLFYNLESTYYSFLIYRAK